MDDFSKDLKRFLSASLVGLVIAVSSKANAGFQFNLSGMANFYFGAALGWNKCLISKTFARSVQGAGSQSKVHSTALNVLAPLLGIQIDNKYGVEIGYGIYSNLKFSGDKSGSLRLRNYFIDVMRFLPLEAYPLDFLVGAGIGRMHIKERNSSSSIISGGGYNKFGFRVKGGIQYIIDPNWNVRSMLIYQRVGDRSNRNAIKTMRSVSVDFVYLV